MVSQIFRKLCSKSEHFIRIFYLYVTYTISLHLIYSVRQKQYSLIGSVGEGIKWNSLCLTLGILIIYSKKSLSSTYDND